MPDTALAIPLGLSLTRGALRLLSRTVPAVASRVAADLFMTPRRFAAPPRERVSLENATPFEVRVGAELTVQAWRWGSGPVVILVHGWEGRGSQLTPFVGPLVDAGHTVITFDAPGHGKSRGSRSSLPHFMWALRSVAEAVGEPFAILAHSLGCAAATLALRDGLAAERLVFVSPPLNPVEYTRRFGEILGLDDDIIDRMRVRIEERFLRKWSDYSLAATAREMTARLLVIHDRDDIETLWSDGAELARVWPGARLVSTEGLGHRRILRDSTVVSTATEFIAARE
ncbi:MAG TPA: alpha/beta fold hydrolase [Thermoanaerobaculia bacterium]|nr:alpha/beta fold hydrolase [Thermoanaerobaculia bacterium]